MAMTADAPYIRACFAYSSATMLSGADADHHGAAMVCEAASHFGELRRSSLTAAAFRDHRHDDPVGSAVEQPADLFLQRLAIDALVLVVKASETPAARRKVAIAGSRDHCARRQRR